MTIQVDDIPILYYHSGSILIPTKTINLMSIQMIGL